MTEPELTTFALRRALSLSISTHASFARRPPEEIKSDLVQALDLYVSQNPSAPLAHVTAIERAIVEVRQAEAWPS